jgi:hypothetical protein
MTNSQSHFLYIVGEDVVFSIGDIVFPTVVGQEMISLVDLTGTSTDDVPVRTHGLLITDIR